MGGVGTVKAELLHGPLDGLTANVPITIEPDETGEATTLEVPATVKFEIRGRFVYYGVTSKAPLEYTFEGEADQELVNHGED